ncbi:MAG TPA: aldehyde dehydrogenase [Caulobacteraceae bacterium]|jgi:acyl-CoA reductase-like NAD-dependent aldehyde dehydrogenase
MNIDLLIGGRKVAASGGATFERRNPVTGEVATVAAAATVADAKAAVDAAQAAFPKWSAMGPSARRKIINKAADILEARTPDFITLVSGETGGSPGWGGFNCYLAAGMLREAAAITTQVVGQTIPTDKPGMLSMAIRSPAGVVLGIAPWNAPVILGVRSIAVPLAVGNTVVMKASEICPGVQALIGECLMEAGVPEGAVNVITHAPADAPKIVEALIAHPAVRRVNFTGSTRVGKIIGELSARHLKPAVLELGGKAPLLVLDDANLDDAVAGAAFGAFMHQGQICMSTERVVVDEKVADSFVAKFAAKASSLPAGDPRGGNVVLGSLVSVEAAEKVERLVKDAVDKGARLVAGGKREGSIMEATVLDHVKPHMDIYYEESFGPVASVIRAKGDDALVEIANDTEYGLAAAVFSRDINRAVSVAQRIQTGICHINGATVADEPQIPFGGVKASGYGRFGGPWGIAEFTDTKWLTIESEQHYPF